MILNEELSFGDVRYLISSKTGFSSNRNGPKQISYDAGATFVDFPVKVRLEPGTVLTRLDFAVVFGFFNGVWWMKQEAMRELLDACGGDCSELRREWQHQSALPKASKGTRTQIVEIQLTEPVFAWVGIAGPLFNKPGGIEQVYLPNLSRGASGDRSDFACLLHTYTVAAV